MSIIASLVLKNAANADRTFTRESGNGLTVTLRDAAQAIWAHAARVVLRAVTPSARGSVVREQQEVFLPVYDALGVKLREYRFSGEALIPISGTEAERDEFLALVKSLYASTVMAENVSDLNLSQ